MGLATAQLLASRGAKVSLADINEDGLKAALKSLPFPEKHIYTVVDVSNSQSVNAWIDRTVAELGGLHGAVNMAGVIRPCAEVSEITDEDWDLTFAVNTRGVLACIRAQLRAMKPGGSIVSLLSLSSQTRPGFYASLLIYIRKRWANSGLTPQRRFPPRAFSAKWERQRTLRTPRARPR